MSDYIIEKDELLCRGKRVSFYRRVAQIEGRKVYYDFIDFGKSVVIIPITDMEEVVLIRQWRPVLNRWILELPAGKIEEDEKPEEAAVRELIEETGYSPTKVEELGKFVVSPGYSNEVIYVYLAVGLRYVGSSPEDDELIKVRKCRVKECVKLLMSEDLIDMKSLASLMLLMEKLPLT